MNTKKLWEIHRDPIAFIRISLLHELLLFSFRLKEQSIKKETFITNGIKKEEHEKLLFNHSYILWVLRCFHRFRFAIKLLKKGIRTPLTAFTANFARLKYKNSVQ